MPLYLHHRYQVEAVASALGGLSYHYALRGDGRRPWIPVPAAEQQAALDALLRTLAPSELTVPGHILELLPPRPDGFDRHRELFPRNTGLPFDILTPATVAADMTVSFVLRPDRAARLVNQKALDATLPGLGEVIDRLVRAAFEAKPANRYEAEVARVVSRVLVERLTTLAASAPAPQVRAVATMKLRSLRDRLKARAVPAGEADTAAHLGLIVADVTRFLDWPFEPAKPVAIPAAPPGAPIGDPGQWWLDASPAAASSWWRWLWEEWSIEN